jgi:hypothetical protein
MSALPEIPIRIRDAAKHGELVIFVGAGVSMLCGSPDWRGFANGVVAHLESECKISYLEAEQLRKIDSRRTLSIAIALAEESCIEIPFDKILHPCEQRREGVDLYALLNRLRPVFVTTNYDKWLTKDILDLPVATTAPIGAESDPPKKRRLSVCDESKNLTSNLLVERGAVIHLHGSLKNHREMIMSLRDYIRHYSDERVKHFLQEMFKYNTVLFIGYSLSEFELLEHIVRANEVSDADRDDPRHFLLYAYVSADEIQKNYAMQYLDDQCGIRVLPYCIDKSGYGELLTVLKDWESKLDVSEPSHIDYQLRIDKWVADEKSENARAAAIKFVTQFPEFAPYLINSLRNPIWFQELAAANFFNSIHSPVLREVKIAERTGFQADGWPALQYLEHIADKVDASTATRVAQIVRDVTKSSIERNIDNWRTNWSLATIFSRLPLSSLAIDDFASIDTWLTSRSEASIIIDEMGKLLSRLLSSNETDDAGKALKLVGLITKSRTEPEQSMTVQTELIDSYHLAEALKPSASLLGECCGKAGIDLLISQLRERLGASEEQSGWSLWRSAIEDHEQDANKDEVRHVLLDACRDALSAFSRKDLAVSREVLVEALASTSPTIVRIGIFVCGEQYGSYGDLFWEKAKSDWFVELPYWHEMFWLIKKNFSRFSAADRAQFLKFVVDIKGDWKEGVDAAEMDSIQRRDLLHAAYGQGDQTIDEMYIALVQKYGGVRDHPDFHFYSGGAAFVGETSPTNSDELAKMTDDELAVKMESFVQEGHGWDGPSYRGFGEAISAAVRGSIYPFPQKMDVFLDVNPEYQCGLLRGLRQRVSDDNRAIDWPQALDFMLSVSRSKRFISELGVDAQEGFQVNAFWIASAIADLVKAGVKNETNGIPASAFDNALTILVDLLTVMKAAPAAAISDAVTHAINTSRGRVLETLINLALLIRRDEGAINLEQSKIWKKLEAIFDREIKSSVTGQNAEFATLGALYLPNLHFLSAQWTKENFSRFFPATSNEAWRCAVQGFSHQHYMYEWIYLELRSAGHLDRILQTSDLPESVSKRTVQFIGIAYLNGLEPLESGSAHLLWKLVSELRQKELCELCWFFWTMRGDADLLPAKKKKILEFWFAVSAKLTIVDTPYPKIQSSLTLLAAYIETIDQQNEKVWVEAAPYAQVAHNGYILMKNLLRLSKTYPTSVARVFKAALTGFIPDYDREDVIACVEQLAEHGLAGDALDICIEYAKSDSLLLKDTYEKLRTSAAK